jgi:hypothetical protein
LLGVHLLHPLRLFLLRPLSLLLVRLSLLAPHLLLFLLLTCLGLGLLRPLRPLRLFLLAT